MRKEEASSIRVDQEASAPTPTLSLPAPATQDIKQHIDHKRSELNMPKDTELIAMPLAIPPVSHRNIQCQPSKAPPPLLSPTIDGVDLASIARLEARGLSVATQPVIIDSAFKPLSPDEIKELSRPRSERLSLSFASSWGALGTSSPDGWGSRDKRRVKDYEDLEGELDEPIIKGIGTAGLVGDGWRVTKGLAVVKGDVERPIAK